jgi:hypothetical protein
VYAAGTTPLSVRPAVMSALRKGFRWHGDVGPTLIAHLAGRGTELSVSAASDPVAWALRVLQIAVARPDGARRAGVNGCGSDPSSRLPSRREVQQAFRDQLRNVHPDHGADDEGAAPRIG